MSYREFLEWGALYEELPFGQRRDDLHAALVASVIANSFSKKRFGMKEFLLEPKKEMSLADKFRAALGGK